MRICFFCPKPDRLFGGIKVIFKNVEFLRQLGFDAYIFHPRKRDFKGAPFRLRKSLGLNPSVFKGHRNPSALSWFEHAAPTRPATAFSPNEDCIVIPEVWAAEIGMQALELGIPYVIYIQNGYLIDSGAASTFGKQKLEEIYKRAKMLLSISDDSTALLLLTYPSIDPSKIFRVIPHVSPAFQPGPKEKIISLMPRKIGDHGRKLRYLLEGLLPAGWKIEVIENQPESTVARVLSKSSIFLSLCHLEGFGLPPLEAALSGNVVIGYTGQGGKEFFIPPLLHEVVYGDFQNFIEKTLEAIKELDNPSQKLIGQREEIRKELAIRYGAQREQELINRAFSQLIKLK